MTQTVATASALNGASAGCLTALSKGDRWECLAKFETWLDAKLDLRVPYPRLARPSQSLARISPARRGMP